MSTETNVMTPTFRVSYPSVFTAQKNDLNGQMEYTVTALFAKGENLAALEAAAKKAAEKKWGTDKTKWPTTLKSPFRNQGEKAKLVEGKKVLPQGYEEGAVFLTLKSKQRPGIVDQTVQDIIDPSQFYAGCYARATVSAYAYDNKGNRGVAFGLGNIQKVKDGDAFSGRTKAVDDFAPLPQTDTPVTGANGLGAGGLFT